MKKTLMLLVLLNLLIGCRGGQQDLEDLAVRMAQMDGVEMSQADENRVAQLILKIRRLEEEIGEVIDKQRERSEYLKLLGLKYMDYRMWIPAAESFNQAIEITPANSRLHYYRAVCFGQQAKLESQFTVRQEYFDAAEEDYLIALRLDPRYSSASYGLAVLYVYELGRPGEAADLLDQLLDSDPSYTRALLLRGRLYEDQGNTPRAVEVYRRIVDLDRDPQAVATAETRLTILGGNP